jgi:mannosyltransferase OCH1-like enzyme
MIPKNIYQTWKTKELPSNIQNQIDIMMKLNKDYKRFLYDDNDIDKYIKENYSERIYNAYCKLNIGAAKADLWRYLILYQFGGIYLDIDSIIKTDLNKIIKDNDEFIISREKNKGILLQWFFIVKPQHPVLLKIINKVIDNIEKKVSNDLMYVTGPRVFTQCINEYYGKEIYNLKDNEINQLKVIGYDFNNMALWKMNGTNNLYKNNPHWTKYKLFSNP